MLYCLLILIGRGDLRDNRDRYLDRIRRDGDRTRREFVAKDVDGNDTKDADANARGFSSRFPSPERLDRERAKRAEKSFSSSSTTTASTLSSSSTDRRDKEREVSSVLYKNPTHTTNIFLRDSFNLKQWYSQLSVARDLQYSLSHWANLENFSPYSLLERHCEIGMRFARASFIDVYLLALSTSTTHFNEKSK
jgi:hypothetical protein